MEVSELSVIPSEGILGSTSIKCVIKISEKCMTDYLTSEFLTATRLVFSSGCRID